MSPRSRIGIREFYVAASGRAAGKGIRGGSVDAGSRSAESATAVATDKEVVREARIRNRTTDTAARALAGLTARGFRLREAIYYSRLISRAGLEADAQE